MTTCGYHISALLGANWNSRQSGQYLFSHHHQLYDCQYVYIKILFEIMNSSRMLLLSNVVMQCKTHTNVANNKVDYTPLCKSNGTFFSGMDINALTSVLHKYKTPVTKCCTFNCCWVNLVCIRHLIVKIMPEKHAWVLISWCQIHLISFNSSRINSFVQLYTVTNSRNLIWLL